MELKHLNRIIAILIAALFTTMCSKHDSLSINEDEACMGSTKIGRRSKKAKVGANHLEKEIFFILTPPQCYNFMIQDNF